MNNASASWNDLPLSPELFELIEKAGYVAPSPVQVQSIPLIMEGHDILVSSQTGSGKTASFVLPVVEKFKNKNGTYILALAPTREIAQQTGAVFEQFGAPLGLKTVVCIGGASIPAEKEALSSSPHIIVATPGRLCDHLERGNVWLDFIQCLIFDEADRMLEMGFAKQIDMISEQIPKNRQTLMFSATYDPKVEKLAKSVMREPKEITIKREEGSVPKIDQRLIWTPEEKKNSQLLSLLRREPGTVFVFVNSKEKVFQVWRALLNKKFEEATYIHSDITQEAREAAVADFKSGKFRVLIATDIVGRGIDVDDVAHVVNFDVPREAPDYIHRIGRTGRRGKEGMATTFAVPVKDEKYIRAIEKLRGIPSPEKRDYGQTEARSGRPQERRGRGPREHERRPEDRGPEERRPRARRPREEARPIVQPQKENKVQPKQEKIGFFERIKRLFS